MKIFIDANVLVAVLNRELPLFNFAARLLSVPQINPKFQLCTTPICLAISYYFAQKKVGTQKANEKIRILAQNLKILEVGAKEVKMTITNKMILDFEDGLQYYAALHGGCEIIVTENEPDFHFSEIPVFNTKTYLLNHFNPNL